MGSSVYQAPPHMWSIWKEKYGVVEALKTYFPDLVATDPTIQMALFQIEAAEALIDAKMSKMAGDDD